MDSHLHVRLLDFNDLISLWKQFYNKLSDVEKNFLPCSLYIFLVQKNKKCLISNPNEMNSINKKRDITLL